jgi:hypothetical protein
VDEKSAGLFDALVVSSLPRASAKKKKIVYRRKIEGGLAGARQSTR